MTSDEPPIGGTEQLATAQAGAGRPDVGPAGTAERPGDEWAGEQSDEWTSERSAERDAAGRASVGSAGQLLDPADAAMFARRWDDIQTAFVDQPRQAVMDADVLVADVISRLTRMFADEHTRLEEGLEREDDASTEELRVGLQRYRDFFHRLLAA
jgi:hypothetical protein